MITDVILYPPISGPDGNNVSRYENCTAIEYGESRIIASDGTIVTTDVCWPLLTFHDADGHMHNTSLPFEVITRPGDAA